MVKVCNNELRFSFESGFELEGGGYAITEFKVPNAQDRERFLRPGKVVPLEDGGTLRFRLGRKASDQVATWFKDRIPGGGTTFNKIPSRLHFAFLGTLELRLGGSLCGSFWFDEMGIAHEDSDLGGRWWFGGRYSRYLDNCRIGAAGRDSSGRPVWAVFRRMGNSAEEIRLESISPLQPDRTPGLRDKSSIDDTATLGGRMGMAHFSFFPGTAELFLQ